jgi:uncharacterized protein YhbP (UPF0306 family)
VKVQDLVVKYLDEARLMQVATSTNNIPWCCTVYFAVDNLHNIYWISLPDRQHSDDIAQNPHVAGTIVVAHSYGQKVRGVQFRGTARMVTDPAEITEHTPAYAERYQLPTLAQDIISGQHPHRLYTIKPELFVLFDEQNFPDDPRQEWYVS